MFNNLLSLLDMSRFAPHGICLLWDARLVYLHIVSDTLVAIAYFSIPITGLYYLYRAKNVLFPKIYICFVIFILACGTTHLYAIKTIFIPDYFWEGIIKAITAISSVGTAIILLKAMPKLIDMPSYTALEKAIKEKDKALLELRAATLERLAVEQKLKESERLEAIGRIAAGVAHDFNNLLQIIIINNGKIKRLMAADSPYTKNIESSLVACDRAASLVDKLLIYSRQQIFNPQNINANEIATKFVNLVYSLLDKNIILKVFLCQENTQVDVDSEQLQNALLNLITNSRDALNNEGEIILKTSIESRTNKRYVKISVMDNGSGISPEIINNIFDPFFTTKPQGRGTGLGLSQVHGFANQAGGFVEAESTNRGTTISIYLPQLTT